MAGHTIETAGYAILWECCNQDTQSVPPTTTSHYRQKSLNRFGAKAAEIAVPVIEP